MIRYRPAELDLNQYENAILLTAIDILDDLKDDGFRSDGIDEALEGLNKFAGMWCSDCPETETVLKLANPVKGWKNR